MTEILTAFAERCLGPVSVAHHFKNNCIEKLLWKNTSVEISQSDDYRLPRKRKREKGNRTYLVGLKAYSKVRLILYTSTIKIYLHNDMLNGGINILATYVHEPNNLIFRTKLKLIFPRGREPRGVKATPMPEFLEENVPRMQFIPHPVLASFPLLAHGSSPSSTRRAYPSQSPTPTFSSFQEEADPTLPYLTHCWLPRPALFQRGSVLYLYDISL